MENMWVCREVWPVLIETVAFCVSSQEVMRTEYGSVWVPDHERPTLSVECVSSPLRMTAEYLMKSELSYAALSVLQGVSSAPHPLSGCALLAATCIFWLYSPSGMSVVHSHVKQCVSLHPSCSLSTSIYPSLQTRLTADITGDGWRMDSPAGQKGALCLSLGRRWRESGTIRTCCIPLTSFP